MRLTDALVSLAALPFDRSLSAASPWQMKLVAELKQELRGLAPRKDEQRETTSEWSGNLGRLRELVLEDDPRRFLRWDVIQRTMFVRYAGYIRHELAALRRRPDWNLRWRPALIESRTGHPVPYLWWPQSSANLIHHAYHIAEFEREAQHRATDLDVVVEFGGGYGNCCRLFHRLGFRGVYVIHDLPQFSALQRFFLRSESIPVQNRIANAATGVICVSSEDQLEAIRPRLRRSRSLFLATWSLSETPSCVRERIRPIAMECRNVFVAYQHQFGGIDNEEYFAQWKADAEFSWRSWEIPHLPRNGYLLGQSPSQSSAAASQCRWGAGG